MKRWFETAIAICMLTSFVGFGVALLILPGTHWFHAELKSVKYYAGLAGVIGGVPLVIGFSIGLISKNFQKESKK